MQVELGVVEDRMDPLEMGRVRVRILGKHSPNLSEIPTDSLPWATVMLPTTSPSVSGLGHTQFLVEGSWVVLAFNDDFMQDPIVLGTVSGMPAETAWEQEPDGVETKGFKDPFSNYPFLSREPDYNRLGRGINAEDHVALMIRRGLKVTDIPKATKPDVATVETLPPDPPAKWDEPDPKSNTYAQYPFNHVYESESGHVIEVDDSPDGERLMTQHKSGTFEEIHPTGDKVTKIVRDQFEITIGKKSVYVMGSCDLTVDGNVRQLIKGDYVLEVEGDMTTKVHKNRYTKIGARGDADGGGNDAFEIIGNRTGNISKAETLRIGEDSTITTFKNHKHTINGNWDQTIMGNTQITTTKECNLTTHGNFGTFSAENSSIKVGLKLQVDSGELMTIKTATENIELLSGGDIHLNKDK
jgi:hypothetical protein